MSKPILVLAGLLGLVLASVAGAAPPTNASPGATPFAGCTADQAALQQSLGSVLYPGSEIEPRSAINPSDPRNIVGEYQQDRWSDGGARGLVASVSHDGGASWTRVVVPKTTRCAGGVFDRASDPWVSFAPNGNLYAISLTFDAFDTHNAILVSKSMNGGDTWSDPIALADDMTYGLDKQSITADPVDSKYVYAA